MPAPMEVRATTDPPLQTGADTICVGLVEGEGVAHDVPGDALGALVESGEARTAPRKVAVAHAEGARWVLVGLGARERLDAEGARVAAAVAEARARDLGARALCWELPHHVDDDFAAGLVEGTLLSAYRFDRFKSDPDEDGAAPGGLASLLVSAHHDVAAPVEAAAIVAAAQNAARDLQNTPSNELTPTRLAERARELAGELRRTLRRGRRSRDDRRARHGRLRGRGPRQRRGARADHAPLRAARGRRAGARAWWARPSRSTPAASRSSPRPRWRR